MSTVAAGHDAELGKAAGAAAAAEPEPRFGAATPFVVILGVFVLSLVTWWGFGDPKWSFINSSQPAVGADLFWAILATIFTGFTFGGWPFGKLAQPLGGLLQVAFDIAFAFFAVWMFTFVLGHWDPTFSHHAPKGAGYTATAFVVLIGFYAFALAAAGWAGYPFERFEGPAAGVAQWLLGAFITMVGVVWLVYPNFNAGLAAHAPIKLVDALGWVYSSIVVLLLATQLWDSWPWALIPNRHLRALGAFVVTLGGGALLYLLFAALTKALVPTSIQHLATFSPSAEAAQLGVNFSFWCLAWGLLGIGPTKYKPVVNRVIKTVVVAALAIGLYELIMQLIGTRWLHFPAMIPGRAYGGDPLTWTDWAIEVLLLYTVCLGAYGSTRARRSAG